MPAISVSVKADVYLGLEMAVKSSGFTKSKITEMALSKFLKELEEEKQDLEMAQKISAEVDSGKMKTYSSEDIYKELGLA